MSIDHNYARGKLKLLLRDLSNYNAGEFWREMSRIASGATASIHAEGLKAERDALAAHVEQLQEAGDKLREPWDLSKILGAETRRRVEGWDKARAESPASSLARRDALKEAKTVESWADCLESIIRHVEAEHSKDPNYPAIGAEGMGEFAADMRTEAENLRKKAEGHQ